MIKFKITSIEKRRQKTAQNIELILIALDWTDVEYCEFQMQRGEEFLQHKLGKDHYSIPWMTRSKAFWQWWKNQWNLRDDVFFEDSQFMEFIPDTNLEEPLYYFFDRVHLAYRAHHSVARLQIIPSNAVLADSWNLMIGEMMQEARKEDSDDVQ